MVETKDRKIKSAVHCLLITAEVENIQNKRILQKK